MWNGKITESHKKSNDTKINHFLPIVMQQTNNNTEIKKKNIGVFGAYTDDNNSNHSYVIEKDDLFKIYEFR